MDERWLKPALTTGNTIDEISEVAERMSSITAMLDGVFTWMLQEGATDEKVSDLRVILSDLHTEEREQSNHDEEPYEETTVRTTYVASIVFREMANFLEGAARAFIVDYEVINGGDS